MTSAILAEYGFDCIRLSEDWAGADFLAYHKNTERTLQVQLKSCLVIDKKYLPYEDLYICFPLDKTEATWYLLKHRTLKGIAQLHNPQWFNKTLWKEKGQIWSFTGTKALRAALEPYEYRSSFGNLGYREARAKHKQEIETFSCLP